jgi:hypothetical protein
MENWRAFNFSPGRGSCGRLDLEEFGIPHHVDASRACRGRRCDGIHEFGLRPKR